MRDCLRIFLGYWPAFALAAVALTLSAMGQPALSLLLSAASITYSVTRYRRAAKKRACEMDRPAVHPVLIGGGPRTFEPFTSCPSCQLPTYHVFSAPREKIVSPNPLRWAMGVGDVWVAPDYETVSVWNKEGSYRVYSAPEVMAEPVFVTVVDRECLSCGHEWTETVAEGKERSDP